MSYGERPYWDWGNYEVFIIVLTAVAFFYGRSCLTVRDHIGTGEIMRYLLLYVVLTTVAFFYGRSCLTVRDHIGTGEIMRYVSVI